MLTTNALNSIYFHTLKACIECDREERPVVWVRFTCGMLIKTPHPEL